MVSIYPDADWIFVCEKDIKNNKYVSVQPSMFK